MQAMRLEALLLAAACTLMRCKQARMPSQQDMPKPASILKGCSVEADWIAWHWAHSQSVCMVGPMHAMLDIMYNQQQ